jgi:cardiolipin synthase C
MCLKSRRLPVAVLALALLLTAAGCATLPANVQRAPSYSLRDTDASELGRTSRSLLAAHPGESGFRPLTSGVDALLARILLADKAERSLDAQYYIWHNDLTGRFFVDALLRAADRGVRVRVLLDDIGVGADDEKLLQLDAHPNVEIRLFNPVASRRFRGLNVLTDFARVNRRMHNKAFIADNQAAILGGRNIGDEYFDAHDEVVFRDLDVLLVGPAVNDVSTAFDRYWNDPLSFGISTLLGRSGNAAATGALRAELAAFVDSQRASPYAVEARARLAGQLPTAAGSYYWGDARLLYDDPEKISRSRDDTTGHLVPQFAGIGSRSQKELIIVSPYFIPGDAGVQWLRQLASRGVRVTVITNSLAATDVSAVHAGYQRYREALLEAGVRLYELKPQGAAAKRDADPGGSRASLHAKTFVFDRRIVFIGSLNLDPRSVQINTEIGVMCESPALAGELAGRLERVLDKLAWRLERVADASGQPRIAWIDAGAEPRVRSFDEPDVSPWRKLSVWLLSLLPIESEL